MTEDQAERLADNCVRAYVVRTGVLYDQWEVRCSWKEEAGERRVKCTPSDCPLDWSEDYDM